MGTHQAAAGDSCAGLHPDGNQPRLGTGPSRHDEILDRQCRPQAPDAISDTDRSGGVDGDRGARTDFLRVDAAFIQIRTTDDFGASLEGAGAYRTSAGVFL